MLVEPRGEEPLVVQSTKFAETVFGMPCGFIPSVDSFPMWGSLLRLLWCENAVKDMLLHRAGVCGSVVSAGVSPWLLLEASVGTWVLMTRHRGVPPRRLDFVTDRCALSVAVQCVSMATYGQSLLVCVVATPMRCRACAILGVVALQVLVQEIRP